MAAAANLKIDDREMRALFRSGDRIVTRAAFRAMNGVAKNLKTRTKRGVSKTTKVRPGAVGRRIRVRQANRAHPRVTLIVYSRPVTAKSAGGRQTKNRGFTGNGRNWPHAFSISASGTRGVVVVRGREGALDETTPSSAGGAGNPRYPLQAVRIAIHREALAVVEKVIQRGAREAWDVEFPRLLELGLAGAI